MIWFSISLAAVLFLLVAVQCLPSIGFLRQMRRWKPVQLADEDCPRVAIIMSLRGYDPFFEKCFPNLLAQDYPDYELRIVIDNKEDPAWKPVNEMVAESGATNVKIESLDNPLATCGLKNSSVLQAIAGLDDSFEVVAFIDGDAAPSPTWLRDLVSPLADENVAVSSGQRWYMPLAPNIGSLIRYVWNAMNIVAMSNVSIWGGSFAIKRRVLAETDLLDCWKTSLTEDVMIYDRIKKAGHKMAFVPASIMINHETCGIGSLLSWMSRQVLLGRLYHFGWPWIFAHGIGSMLLWIVALSISVYSIATNEIVSATWILSAFAAQIVGILAILFLLEGAVRKIARMRGEEVGWVSPLAILKLFPAILLTQIVFSLAVIKAARMREVDWRGVTYRIHSTKEIELLEYRRYESTSDTENVVSSI